MCLDKQSAMDTDFLERDKLMALASKFTIHLKSWVTERLGEERQTNRWEVDRLKNELTLVMQQEVTSVRDSMNVYAALWERGRSVVKDSAASVPGERLREAERKLTKLQKESEAMEELKRRLAKMEEDHARERMEAVKRENDMSMAMKKCIAQLEEERAREKREMEERESKSKREMSRYMAQVEEERARERKDKEEMYRQIRGKTDSVENRSSEKLTKADRDELTGSCPLKAARAQSEPSLTADDLPVNLERRKRGFFRRLFGKRKGKKC